MSDNYHNPSDLKKKEDVKTGLAKLKADKQKKEALLINKGASSYLCLQYLRWLTSLPAGPESNIKEKDQDHSKKHTAEPARGIVVAST